MFLRSLSHRGDMGHPVLAGNFSIAGIQNVSRTMSCFNFLGGFEFYTIVRP